MIKVKLLELWKKVFIPLSLTEVNPLNIRYMNKGGKFLKKLWCCVGGSITR